MIQLLVFLFLCLVWGSTWIAIKVTLEGMPPFYGAAVRFSIAIVMLLLYALLTRQSLKVSKKELWIIGISGALMYIFDYGLIYWGEQYLSAGITAIFFATFPLFTAIGTNFLFRSEKFHLRKFLGLVLGFAGICIVFYDQWYTTDFNTLIILGSLAIVIGAAGGATSVVIVKKYLQKTAPLALTLYQMVLGSIFLWVFAFLLEAPDQIQLNGRVISAVIYLGGIGSALAFVLYYWLLQHMSAITLSLIIYITPIVAVIIDYFFYGEIVTTRVIFGTLVIFSGIALTQFRNSRS
ncbi:MAG: EamA family transporter [Calditrichia bacterium]